MAQRQRTQRDGPRPSTPENASASVTDPTTPTFKNLGEGFGHTPFAARKLSSQGEQSKTQSAAAQKQSAREEMDERVAEVPFDDFISLLIRNCSVQEPPALTEDIKEILKDAPYDKTENKLYPVLVSYPTSLLRWLSQ